MIQVGNTNEKKMSLHTQSGRTINTDMKTKMEVRT